MFSFKFNKPTFCPYSYFIQSKLSIIISFYSRHLCNQQMSQSLVMPFLVYHRYKVIQQPPPCGRSALTGLSSQHWSSLFTLKQHSTDVWLQSELYCCARCCSTHVLIYLCRKLEQHPETLINRFFAFNAFSQVCNMG